ncbi:enoyl-CoA hydratase/isomerase family protein, partial [Phenylobacterium aquaticum]
SGSELAVSWRLQRTIGPYRTRDMLLTGQPMKAVDALAAGLVSRLVPDADLAATGAAIADAMLAASPDSLRVSKRTFDATLEGLSFDAALELEERGQIQIIRAGRAAMAAAAKG